MMPPGKFRRTRRGHYLSWSPDPPDQRDYVFKAPSLVVGGAVVQSPPARVDLHPQCPAIVNQWQFQSCTANALSALWGFLQLKELVISGQQTHEFDPVYYTPASRMFIWYNARSYIGYQQYNYGSFIRDGIKSMNQIGVCDEQRLPYFREVAFVRPSDICYQDAAQHKISSYMRLLTKDDMVNCLASGFPFTTGISLYTSFDTDQTEKTGVVPLPLKDESYIGGHAIVVCGYDLEKQIFMCRNSWGAYWGDRGKFTLPMDYLDPDKTNLAADAWTIRA